MSVVAPRLRGLRILWGGIFAFSLVLFVLPLVLPPMPASKMPSFFPLVLGLVSMAITVVSFWLPRNARNFAFRSFRDRVEEVVIATDDVGYRAENKRRRVLRLDSAALSRVFDVSQTGMILSIALADSIGLFGFVLNRLGFPYATSLPFFASSTLLIALRFPTLPAILGRVARVVEAEVEIDA